jgi:hypothetical protein
VQLFTFCFCDKISQIKSFKILKRNIMKKKINWMSIGLYTFVWTIIILLVIVAIKILN